MEAMRKIKKGGLGKSVTVYVFFAVYREGVILCVHEQMVVIKIAIEQIQHIFHSLFYPPNHSPSDSFFVSYFVFKGKASQDDNFC